jgi:hypothetical protein
MDLSQRADDLESMVYDAMTEARDNGDFQAAHWLFRVWLKLPSARPISLLVVSDRAGRRRGC